LVAGVYFRWCFLTTYDQVLPHREEWLMNHSTTKIEIGEMWLRHLLERLPAGAYTCDAEGLITYFNQRAVEVWGRTPKLNEPEERFCGSFRLYSIDGTPMRHDQCWMALAIENDEEYNGREVIIERPDGSRLTGLAHASPIHDEAGKLIGAVNVVLNITEQKQAEQALRESERRFREMIDALPVAIYTTDAEGRLTHFNPAAVEFSGHTPELGTDSWCVSWKLYYPDGSPMQHDECPMAVALKEGLAVRGAEAIAERPDGKRVWFQPYPTPLHDDQGRVVSGINMLMDISERKKNEEALLHSHAELSAHAEELARFNRAAVGREMRMIELKKEVNELCLRLGEAARYPLEFERDEKGKEAYV
jgi:PAS domain S-box-containing protein